MNQAIGADAGVRELIFTPTEIAFLAGGLEAPPGPL